MSFYFDDELWLTSVGGHLGITFLIHIRNVTF